MKSERRERVFLVRLWSEGDSGSAHPWRGSVHDVSCGPKRFITAPQEIADFVALRLCAGDATVASGATAASDATGATEPDWTERRRDRPRGALNDPTEPKDAQRPAQPDEAER